MKVTLFIINREAVALYNEEGKFITKFTGKLCEEKAKCWADLHGYDINNILRRMDSK